MLDQYKSRGDMSLVGPGPITHQILSSYGQENINLVLKNLPVIAGIGSIVFRNEKGLLVSESDMEPNKILSTLHSFLRINARAMVRKKQYKTKLYSIFDCNTFHRNYNAN